MGGGGLTQTQVAANAFGRYRNFKGAEIFGLSSLSFVFLIY